LFPTSICWLRHPDDEELFCMVGQEPEKYRSRRALSDEPVAAPDRVDEDQRPLYPDEVTDEDATQILPRTRRSDRHDYGSDSELSDAEIDRAEGQRTPMIRRTKTILLISAVAAVVILGLAIGYAALAIGKKPVTGPGSTSSSTTSGTSSASPSSSSDVLLTDASMLSAADAKKVQDRSWKVAQTQRGIDDQSPQPACLGAAAVDGQPAPQQTILRLLSASGKNAPGILHQADAYASPEEAAQAYTLAAKALGGCLLTGAYIDSAGLVTGLGNEAVAIVLNVTQGSKTAFRSVVLSRTGRIMNVLDVAQPDKAVSLNAVGAALAPVINAQCKTAGGRCATGTSVRLSPPPIGGDQPGFLAAADLPPVGQSRSSWVKVAAQLGTSRTYLLQNQAGPFGLDEIIVRLKGEKAAQDLTSKIKADLMSCARRKLTATVSQPGEVTGRGAGNVLISGWTAAVSQKTTDGSAPYRVGIVSAGPKAVFTFVNPQKNLDFTGSQWDALTVRAGQRATQVK
jgi:hypothetical protein